MSKSLLLEALKVGMMFREKCIVVFTAKAVHTRFYTITFTSLIRMNLVR